LRFPEEPLTDKEQGKLNVEQPLRANAQHKPARNLSPAQFLEDLVHLGQRLCRHFAVNPPGRSQGENLLQILSRTNGRSLNPDFARRHQDGRETNVLSGQAHGE
jgi:hypothetical protein